MKLDVLEIKNKNAFLIKEKTLESHLDYLLNGEPISSEMKKHKIVVTKKDLFERLIKSKQIIKYIKGNESMSVEDYNSKPQRYNENDPEEKVLRALANKKELNGFEPFYDFPKPEKIEFNIVGYVEDTNSKFISCSVTDRYSSIPVVYSVDVKGISMDEYNILKELYSDHAKFDIPDRSYLRFVRINNKYAFGDHYPFGDFKYTKEFLNLKEAKEEESRIRNSVKSCVKNNVFNEDLTLHKKIQVLSSLKSIKKLKTKKSMDEMLSVLINDLQYYMNKTK